MESGEENDIKCINAAQKGIYQNNNYQHYPEHLQLFL